MEKVYDKCCGIDVHKKLIVACFKKGNTQEIREFGATTRELLEMADWLKDGGCEMVAMESTASYWKPLYNIFESSDLNAIVVNARHMKAVPGRKTDVKDAEWIADLLTHGLLQASYIPDKDQRELRELVRYRKSLVGERNRELNRLQKMLEGANIKISGTITDINGKSARNILEHILSGKQIDSAEYDILYEKKVIAHNLKASKEQIIDDLNGVMSDIQRKMMRLLLKHLDELNAIIKELDDDIDSFMKPQEKQAAKVIQADKVEGTMKGMKLKVGVSNDMAPFSYYDSEQKKITGFDIDLLDKLSEYLGFEYELYPMNMKELEQKIKNKELDLAIAGISITDERQREFSFTDTYYETYLQIVVRKDSQITDRKEITEKKIGVVEGTSSAQYAEDYLSEDNKITYYKTITKYGKILKKERSMQRSMIQQESRII